MQKYTTLSEELNTLPKERQQSLFESLQDRLGEVSSSDIDTILDDRVVVDCEPELTPEMIDRLRAKITAAK